MLTEIYQGYQQWNCRHVGFTTGIKKLAFV